MLKKTGKMKIIKSAAFILFLVTTVFAQDVRIRATVSGNTVSLNEQFSYSLELSGNFSGLPDPEFPDFKDFYVLSGPNTSTNMQWVNGKMSSSKTNTFYLQPKTEGSITIPAARLKYKGKIYSSNTITLKVVRSKTKAKVSGQTRTQSIKDSEISGQNLFIKTLVSKKKGYLGEQFIVTYKLYFKAQVRGYNFEQMPSYAGFWNEKFEMPRQPVIESEVVNGINYNSAVLHKVALFPTQTGKLTIEPMQVSLEAVVQSRRRSRSLFDSFFDDPFGRTVRQVVTTKPVKITVLSLPEQGKPKDFNGAVGDFKFSIRADKSNAEVNEAISLKLKLRGAGNIKLAELPKIFIPEDIEQYEPKISSDVSKDGNRVSGSKTAEIILIPRIPGIYKIKPVHFSYFNPRSKKYETIVTKPISLQISEGKGGTVISGVQSSGLSRKEVSLLGKDIHYIKAFTEFKAISFKPYFSAYFWSVIFIGLIVFMAFVIYDDRQARISGDARLARNRRAGRLASKQLSNARHRLQDQQKSEFYKSVSLALQGFVRDKLNIELTEFSAVNINNVLTERGIPQDEISEYQDVLQESDFKQFAGTASTTEECKALYNRAKNILTRLEKWI